MQFQKTGEMTLSEATKPFLNFSRLVGMSPKSHWQKIYPVFILGYQGLMLFWIWEYHTRREVENYNFNVLVHFFQDLCRVASLLVTLGFGLFDRERYMVPVNDFINVDRSLKSLGGMIDNRVIYRSQILLFGYVLLVPLFFWFVSFAVFMSILTGDGIYTIAVMTCTYYSTIMIICAAVDCTYSSILSIIKKRFKEINFIIRRAEKQGSYLRVNCLEVSRLNARTGNDILKGLRILRKQYHELWGIANRVSDAYGVHLLVGVTTSFAMIASKLWEFYTAFTNFDGKISYAIVGSISWALFYLARLFLLVQASESTVAEAKATADVLQELGMEGNHDPATKGEIRDFLLQLQLEAQSFTACNFLDLDFKMICGILGAVCTYSVILIQMGSPNGWVFNSTANESVYTFDKDNDHMNETTPFRRLK